MPKVLIDGKLQEVSEEEAKNLQQKAEDQSLPSTPITPEGAANIGANADEAKMAGTKTQKQQALKIDVAPEVTATQQQRLQTARTSAADEEKRALEKADRIRQLGSLESRVDDIIKQQFSQGYQEGATPLALETQSAATADMNEEDAAIFQQALAEYQQAVASGDQAAVNQKLVALNQSIDNAMTSAGQVAADYLKSVKDSVGGQIAEQISDEVTLGQIKPEDMGLTADELTNLLGEEWEQLSVPQLRQQIENIRQDEFDKVDALTAELSDPRTSPARRQEVLQELRDIGQLGISGAEDQVQGIEKDIEEANTVMFNGEELTIAELLDDDRITQMVTDLINLPADSEERKKLEDELGEDFTKWIKDHEAALQEFSATMDRTSEAFDTLQEQNKEVKNIEGVGTISDDLMKDLFSDWNQWSADDYNGKLQEQGWYQSLQFDNSISPDNKSRFLNVLNNYKLDKEFANELQGLSPGEAKTLIEDPDTMEDYAIWRLQDRDLADLPAEKQYDAQFLVDFLFGKNVDANNVEEAYHKAVAASKIDPAKRANLDKLGKILGDNEQIDINKIRSFLMNPENKSDSEVSLKAAANGAEFSSRYKEFADAATSPDDMSYPAVFDSMWKYLKDDFGGGRGQPTITPEDIEQAVREQGEGILTQLYENPDFVAAYESGNTARHINKVAANIAEGKLPGLTGHDVNAMWSKMNEVQRDGGAANAGLTMSKDEYDQLANKLTELDRVINESSEPVKSNLRQYRTTLGEIKGYVETGVRQINTAKQRVEDSYNKKIESLRNTYRFLNSRSDRAAAQQALDKLRDAENEKARKLQSLNDKLGGF